MADAEFSLENIVRVTLEAKEIAAQDLEKRIDEARAGAERAIRDAAARGQTQAVVCGVKNVAPKDPVTFAVDGWLRAKGFQTSISMLPRALAEAGKAGVWDGVSSVVASWGTAVEQAESLGQDEPPGA
jgi:hypothetical protein